MHGVLVEESDAVMRITLSRPERLNAFDLDVLLELRAAQVRAEGRAGQVRVVVLAGAGRAFCAGADVRYIQEVLDDDHRYAEFLGALRDVVTGFERLPQPVVAQVHGVALAGGIELMLGCDVIVAARSATIGDQHIRHGFIPGGGSSQRLPRWVSRPVARDMLLTGAWLSADEAMAAGLVSRVVPDDALAATVEEIARDMSAGSWPALAAVKALANRAESVPLQQGLGEEIEAVLAHRATPEFRAGVAAFFSA